MKKEFNGSLNPGGKKKETPIDTPRRHAPRFIQHGGEIPGMPNRIWIRSEDGLWYSKGR